MTATTRFDRAQQLGVVEQPVRTMTARPDVSRVFEYFDNDERVFAEKARALFALSPGFTNMDASTLGSPLRGVREDDEPICSTFTEIRANIATGFGCDADEIAITNSTTDSLSKVLWGLELRAGDEILTTNHEHFGSLAPMAVLRDRLGVTIRRVVLPVGNDQAAEDYVARFAAAITTRTRVMLFSAPTVTTGTLLPIRALTRLAEQHGIISVVDAAHLPGMLDVNFHELGADFIAGSGNKWQCGPPGTGILYMRNKVLPQYNARPLPAFWPVVSVWYPLEGGLPPRTTTSEATYDIGEYIQNTGATSVGRMRGLETACQIWQRIGRGRIERHILHLSRYLKDRIVEHWGDDALYSPYRDPRLLTGLTTFNPFAVVADTRDEKKYLEFVRRLEHEHRIIVKHTQFPVDGSGRLHFGIRMSTRLYHTAQQIDDLVVALRAVSRAMAC
jgi:selenocysteine lyase/cysteine desulfurase